MSDKKHIDRLFQEAFKDFEEIPKDAVWERIESKLKDKKKRRVIPIWWRYAGVAALLLLFLSIGSIYFFNTKDSTTPTNKVVDVDEKNPLKLNKEAHINSEKDDFIDLPKNTGSDVAGTKPSTNNDGNSLKKKTLKGEASNLNAVNKTQVANISSKNESGNIFNKRSASNENPNKKDNGVQSENQNESEVKMATTSEENNTQILFNKSKSELDQTQTDKFINTNKNNNYALANEENEKEKPNSQSEISTLTIEEAIEKSKEIIDDEKELIRWSVAPNAAPVFFNSLGKGSSIDSQFNNNSKTGEINMSYGINASYAINKKLSVRSGINKVNLGYNTNDVVTFGTIGANSSIKVLKNVKPDISNASNDIAVLSTQSFANKSSESFITGGSVNTSINQSLSYIEIPLEIKYMLSDKKLGIDVIGGFSSFFLNDNELYSDFEGNKTRIGEASNVNDISYSANFGLGFNYKVSKKINLNLEPIFKYQINTFNNTSGDFKPYFIGIYTGFGLKF